MSCTLLRIEEAENGYVVVEIPREKSGGGTVPAVFPEPKNHIASNIKDALRLTKIILEGSMSEEQQYSEGFKEAAR